MGGFVIVFDYSCDMNVPDISDKVKYTEKLNIIVSSPEVAVDPELKLID